MSTIGPALRVDSLSPLKVQGSGKRSRLAFYLLRLGQALALVAFLSFCVMWVQWQAATPGISKVSGDFVSFWTAGQLALEGRAADAYRYQPHFLAQLALHGDPEWGYLAFFYPPILSAAERRLRSARLFSGAVPVVGDELRRLCRRTARAGAKRSARRRGDLGAVPGLSRGDDQCRLRAERIPEHGAARRCSGLAR